MTEYDPSSSPPVPEPNDLNRFYWDAVAQRRLELLRCQTCGHYVHFPRPVCNACLGEDLRPEVVSGRGTHYSYTLVMQASHPYFADKVPYLIGVVAIDEEPEVRIPAGIVDCVESELRRGVPVEVIFCEVTPTLTMPFFRPVR